LNNPEHLAIYCTCPDEGTAVSIAETLVNEGLAACVNIIPATRSVYRWKGSTESATEALLMIKTTAGNYEKIEKRVVQLHPYELPEVIGVPIIAGLEPYLKWLSHPEE
jgi:periplasmic divalent cation tolerance protein